MSVTILDGGMGQELIARSSLPPTPLWSTDVMRHAPELVRAVHDDFFAAGAEIATANSYAVHRDRLAPEGLEGELARLQILACEIAIAARDAHGSGQVAGSIGPLTASYRPDLARPPEAAAALIREIAEIQAPFVDFYMVETVSSLQEAEGALMGLAGIGKPVWIGLTVQDSDGTLLRSGEPLCDVLRLIEAYTPDALLLNCSTPEAVTEGLRALGPLSLPTGGYANGFTHITSGFLEDRPTVDALTARTDLTPSAYADHVATWVDLGATLLGGCCEVGPAHIAELAERFGTRG